MDTSREITEETVSRQAAGWRDLPAARSRTLPPLKLPVNVFWNFLGNVVQAISRLVLLVLIVKFCGLRGAGLWVAATAMSALAFTLSDLGLRPLLMYDVQRAFPFQDYFSLRSVCTLLAITGLALAGLFYYGFSHGLLIVLMVGLGRAFDSLSDICHGLLQREERMDRTGQGLCLRYSLGLLATLLVIALHGGILLAILVDALAAAAVFLGWNAPNARRLLAGFDFYPQDVGNEAEVLADQARTPGMWTLCAVRREMLALVRPHRGWLQLAWLSIPLGIVAFEISLMTNLPRFIVDALLGKEALAIFASLLQAAGCGVLFVNALGGAIAPRLSRYYQHGEGRKFAQLLNQYILITGLLGAIPVGLLCTQFGQHLLALLLSPEFLRDPLAARWLVAAAWVLYLTGPLGRGLDAVLRFRTHVVIRAFALLLMVAVIPPLTAAYGLKGAAGGLSLAVASTLPGYIIGIVAAWKSDKPHTLPSSRARQARRESKQSALTKAA